MDISLYWERVSNVQCFHGVSPVSHTIEGQRWDVASKFARIESPTNKRIKRTYLNEYKVLQRPQKCIEDKPNWEKFGVHPPSPSRVTASHRARINHMWGFLSSNHNSLICYFVTHVDDHDHYISILIYEYIHILYTIWIFFFFSNTHTNSFEHTTIQVCWLL